MPEETKVATLETTQAVTTPPSQPAPETPKSEVDKTPPPKSKQEIDLEVDQLMEGLGFPIPNREKKPEPKKEEPEKTVEPVKEDKVEPSKPEDKPQNDAETEKPVVEEKKTKTKKVAPLDTEAIRALARDAAREAIGSSETIKTEPEKSQEQPTLDQTQKRTVQVLQEMQRLQPDKYSGIVDKTIKGWQDFDGYRRRWQEAHPDDEFDPEDDEHSKIADKLLPTYDPDDYDDAKVEMRLNQRLKEREEAQKKEEAARSLPEKLKESVRKAEADLVEATDSELAKVYKTDPSKVKDTDPIAATAIIETRDELAPLIREVDKLTDPNLNYKPIKGNEMHDFLNKFASDCERSIKSLPPEQQFDDQGRRFATTEEFSRIPASRRDQYWIFDHNMLRFALVRNFAQKAKGRIESRKSEAIALAERLGYKKPGSASESTLNGNGQTTVAPVKPASKPNPPSISSSADTIKSGSGSQDGPVPLSEFIASRMWNSD